MAAQPESYGIIALILGMAAIFVTGGFFYLNGGFVPVGPVLVDPVAHRGLLIIYIIVAYLFHFGTPLLCIAAFFFGFPRKDFWTARIGITLATAALLMYVLTVHACLQLIW
jgi:hypothetical protein